MNIYKTVFLVLALGATAGLVGCQREGTMEKAGKQVDKAADSVADSAKDAKDKLTK